MAAGLSQCAAQWLSEAPTGTNAQVVCATTWDPDGSGPQPARVVVAGTFDQVAGLPIGMIAAFDPSTQLWSGLGGLANVVALTSTASGGLFAAVGNQAFSWTGGAWLPVGGSMDGPIVALAVLPNGNLMAAGGFTSAGGVPANGFSIWNGTAWQNLGLGVPAQGTALHVLPNGHVMVGGLFTIGGNQVHHVARWNGLSWTMLGAPANGGSYCFADLPNGDIVAGGQFTSIGGTPAAYIARWDGMVWHPLGGGANARVRTLSATGAELHAGGDFTTIGGIAAAHMATWNGSQWQAHGTGANGPVHSLGTRTANELFAAGNFDFLDGKVVHYVALQASGVWTSMPPVAPRPSLPTVPLAMLGMSNGDMITSAPTVARWDGSRWAPLGPGGPGVANHLAELPNGDLVAVGGGSVFRWNGTSWQSLGTPPSPVTSLATGSDGSVVVGCDGGVFRWSGAGWIALGSLANVTAVAVSRSGMIFASSGVPWVYASTVHRWNGTNWQVIGNVGGRVKRLVMEDSDHLLAAGTFANINGATMHDIARWNGTTWQVLRSGGFPPTGIEHLVADPIVVAGNFSTSPNGPANQIARWDGSSWQTFGSGPAGSIACLARTPSSLLVGGSFLGMNGLTATRFAEYRNPCPASVTTTGSGCSGPGGSLRTDFHPTPWLGMTCTSRTTGLANPSMAFVLYGFTNPNVQLASLHPLGGQGCTLLSNNDIVLLLFPFGGEITTSMTVPVDASFIQVALFHQVVEFSLDAQGFTTGIHSGNGLRLQFGLPL